MENVQPLPLVVEEETEKSKPSTHPNVTAYCRSLEEQGIQFQILPLAKPTSNTET